MRQNKKQEADKESRVKWQSRGRCGLTLVVSEVQGDLGVICEETKTQTSERQTQ